MEAEWLYNERGGGGGVNWENVDSSANNNKKTQGKLRYCHLASELLK